MPAVEVAKPQINVQQKSSQIWISLYKAATIPRRKGRSRLASVYCEYCRFFFRFSLLRLMSSTPLPATVWSATAGTHALSAEVLLAVLLSSRSASCPASFCHLAVSWPGCADPPSKVNTQQMTRSHTAHLTPLPVLSDQLWGPQHKRAVPFDFESILGESCLGSCQSLLLPVWSNMIQYKPISLDVLGSESHSSIDNLAIVFAPHILVERKVPPCSVRTGAGPDADRASNFQAKASTLQD